jgi:hypothetical protein
LLGIEKCRSGNRVDERVPIRTAGLAALHASRRRSVLRS